MDRTDRGESAVDPFAGLKEAQDEYHVYDSHYERIGKVDDLLVDDADRVLYVGIKMGLFGSNSTLVPVEALRVNDKRQLIEIMETEENIKNAPHFGHKDELSPDFEDRVRTYFGLEPLHAARAGQSRGSGSTTDPDRFAPDPRVDTEPGERATEQRGAFLDDPPLDTDIARRDISRSEPRRGPARETEHEPRREPVAESGQRANLDIPLDPPGGVSSSEPRWETFGEPTREPVERSDERPVVRKSSSAASPGGAGAVPVDQWEQVDSTRGGITVHRKRR